MNDDIQSQGYSLDTKEKEIIKEGEKHALISEWSWNKELLVNPKYRT
jgi:hypothetical protein